MVPPLWEGTLLLFNPCTHGFFTRVLSIGGVVLDRGVNALHPIKQRSAAHTKVSLFSRKRAQVSAVVTRVLPDAMTFRYHAAIKSVKCTFTWSPLRVLVPVDSEKTRSVTLNSYQVVGHKMFALAVEGKVDYLVKLKLSVIIIYLFAIFYFFVRCAHRTGPGYVLSASTRAITADIPMCNALLINFSALDVSNQVTCDTEWLSIL